ncbi:hypothetical protein QWZ10_14980 [Paracoccus cavernae]|uniref:CN hydrolase domain-containing protein n=1 Tax=Paracoccus cavernae TaxID=1571207 RepID=A0ABT8DA16_9RHOB|nr:hypothetical protein [Paracoccus cavernae]
MDIVLAARVNLQRSIASEDAANRQGGIDYLKFCIEAADRVGAKIIGGPLYGEPLVFAGRAPIRGRPRRSPSARNAPSTVWPRSRPWPRLRGRSSASRR